MAYVPISHFTFIVRLLGPQSAVETDDATRRQCCDVIDTCTWASAHRGKWDQLTPCKMDEKLKSENVQKEQFSMFMLYFKSNQDTHV